MGRRAIKSKESSSQDFSQNKEFDRASLGRERFLLPKHTAKEQVVRSRGGGGDFQSGPSDGRREIGNGADLREKTPLSCEKRGNTRRLTSSHEIWGHWRKRHEPFKKKEISLFPRREIRGEEKERC